MVSHVPSPQGSQPAKPLYHHSSSTQAISNTAVVPQQFNPIVSHTRSNSDMVKQQILMAQVAAMKKQQSQVVSRPNPAINTQQQ